MLTDELQALVDQTGSAPQGLAARWCAQWPHPVAAADAEAAISSLLAGEAAGIRFFFSDVRRARVLLKLLGLPTTSHPRFRELASAALRRTPEVLRLQALLPMPLELESSEEVLWALTDRARHHEITDRALMIGDTVHVINPTAPIDDDPQIMVHAVALQGSPLARLVRALGAQSEQALAADRRLDALVEALAEDEGDVEALRHARAILLHNDQVHPGCPPKRSEWRAALSALLAAGPPAARLRLRLSEPLAAPQEYDHQRHWRSPFLTHASEGPLRPNQPPHTVLDRLPRCGPVDLGRDEQAAYVRFGPTAPPREPDRHFVAWGEPSEALWKSARQQQLAERDRLPSIQGMADWFAHPLDIPTETWEAADRLVAASWLALRRALRSDEALQLHDGDLFVTCGAACATMRLHAGAAGAVHAALDAEVVHTTYRVNVKNRWGGLEAVDRDRHTVAPDRLADGGMPSALHIWGGGWELRVIFSRSPLLNA